MDVLKIEIQHGQQVFVPGQTLAGRVSWHGEKPPKKARAVLFWRTMGKGTEDSGLMDELEFDNPQAQDNRSFSFRLPEGPYSFSGKLISLVWGVELALKGSRETASQDFILSPFGHEVDLSRTALPEP